MSELSQFCQLLRSVWCKPRTTKVVVRCLVEIRPRTRPIVVFTNVDSVHQTIYAIFSHFNEAWKNRTLPLFTQATSRHLRGLERIVLQIRARWPEVLVVLRARTLRANSLRLYFSSQPMCWHVLLQPLCGTE